MCYLLEWFNKSNFQLQGLNELEKSATLHKYIHRRLVDQSVVVIP